MFENFEKYIGKKQLSKAERTKQRIILSTIEVVGEKGYLNATTRDIVKKAGISMGSLYHHFKNKAEIILAIFEMHLDSIMKIDEMLVENNYPIDKLLFERLKLLISNFVQYPGLFRIFIIEISSFILNEEDVYVEKLLKAIEKVHEYNAMHFEKGRELGYFHYSGDSKEIFRIIVGCVTGFLNFHIIHLKQKALSAEKLNILYEFIFNGLKYKGDLSNEK